MCLSRKMSEIERNRHNFGISQEKKYSAVLAQKDAYLGKRTYIHFFPPDVFSLHGKTMYIRLEN